LFSDRRKDGKNEELSGVTNLSTESDHAHTLCESAKLVGVDPHTYLLTATEAALAVPGTVTLPAAITA
jgi:hypothetical protein